MVEIVTHISRHLLITRIKMPCGFSGFVMSMSVGLDWLSIVVIRIPEAVAVT